MYALAHIGDTSDPHKTLPPQSGHAGAGLVTDGSKVSWSVGAAGTVTGVSVVSANGFAGTVATSTTTPAITLTTTITGLLKGNGTAISASVVTDDVQTKAAIVPNTAPAAGGLLVGNAGATAYAPVAASGAVTLASTGAFSLATPATLTVSTVNAGGTTAHTHAITSSSAPGAAASLLATDASGILGTTGARIVKIWAIDLTVTNNIAGSITGNAATVTTNANLTGPITSSGNATAVASQTGTGTKFVMDTSPTLVTPNIGAATGASVTLSSGGAGVAGAFTSSGGTGTVTITDTGASGGNLKITGDGGVTPNKYLRSFGGSFQIVNSAYGSAVMTLTDAGALAVLGSIGTRNTGTGAFDMAIAHTGTLTASRTVTWNVNDAARAVSLSGDLTVTATASIAGTHTGTSSNTNTGDETGARIATLHHAASVKSALVDADEVTGGDSAASFGLIRTTWTSVKAFLKTYFDTLYQAISTSGSFTATATGLTTAPTQTITYVICGGVVTMNMPSSISGTSNATTFTYTGMPVAPRPSGDRWVQCITRDNTGAVISSVMKIDSAGVINFFASPAAAAFTSSGTKSASALCFSYPI